MSPRARRSRRASLVLSAYLFALASACGGGGGDVVDDDPGQGGVGADGVTVFWWPYGEQRTGWGSQARELPDGSFVAAGARSRQVDTFDPVSYDATVLRVDSRGGLLWQRDFGQAGRRELAHDLAVAPDGSFLIVGEVQPADTADALYARLGSDGTLLWQRTLGDDGWDSALAAAEAAVAVLLTARQVGPFALGHLREVLAGSTPAAFCDAGGSFTIVPAPTQPLAGQSFAVDFASCAASDPEPRTYAGGYTLAVEAASADILAAPYQITTSLTELAVTVTDEAGPSSVAAELGYARAASSADAFVDDTALLAGATFALSRDGRTFGADQLELEAALASGVHRLGPGSARVTCAAVAEPLAVTGSDPSEPSAGRLSIEAPDGSRIVLRAQPGGAVLLELDTSAVGTLDLLLQTTWLLLY